MAKERWFTGFEDANGYDLSVNQGRIMADAKWPARSGDFFYSLYAPQGNNIRASRDFTHTFTCGSNGSSVIARMQYAFRIRQLPASATTQLGGFSVGTTVAPAVDVRCQITAAGVIQVTAAGSASTASMTGFVPILGKWYVLRLHAQYQRNDAGTDPSTASVWVYDGDTMDSAHPVLVGTVTLSGAPNIVDFSLAGQPSLGQSVSVDRIIDYDDWWMSAADGADADLATNPDLAWPGGSRIQAVPITGQAIGGWTGSYLLARDIPNSAVAGNEQTTATPSTVSTFLHDTAAKLGLIPIGQLATDGSDTDTATAPPFDGLPYALDNLASNAAVLFAQARDVSLPIPTFSSTQVAGAGLLNGGVFVRAFTVKMSGNGGSTIYSCGPLSNTVFLSAGAYPNFAAQIDVTMDPATPSDAITGGSTYVRYGVGLLVTNAYNGAGLLNPTSGTGGGVADSATNTDNLSTIGGTLVNAAPHGSLVNLVSYIMPMGTGVPYPFTNPGTRPSTMRFLLSGPQAGVGNPGFGGTGAPLPASLTMATFGNVFTAPGQIADEEKPVVAAIKVIPSLQLSAGTQAQDVLIAGAATSITVNGSFGGNTQSAFAFDWTPRTAAQFDALTFGVRANAALAATLRLGSIVAEVMTAGPCTKRTTGSGQYQQQAGIYTSNNSIQKIPLPFKATAILVKRINATPAAGAFKAWWMGGTQSFIINSTAESIGIMLVEDDGFTVGPSLNANGTAATYAYLAIADGQEDTLNDAYMVTGSFQRQNGSDPDQTVELPMNLLFAGSWTPDVVMLTNNATILKTPDMVAPNSDNFATTGLISTGIAAVGDRTFTTGSSVGVGQWAYWAFKFDGAGLLASVFQYGSFAGTNGAQTVQTNFRGELIVLDHPAAAYNGRFRSDQGMTGTNSSPWIGGVLTTTDITAIGNTSFDVGAGASVTGQTSYWLAWKKDGNIGNTGNTGLPPVPPAPPPTEPDDNICGGGGMHLPPGTTGDRGCTAC